MRFPLDFRGQMSRLPEHWRSLFRPVNVRGFNEIEDIVMAGRCSVIRREYAVFFV